MSVLGVGVVQFRPLLVLKHEIGNPQSRRNAPQSRSYSRRFHPPLASSASGAQYPAGELWDARIKQQRKRIAGIDQDELLDPTLLADPDSSFCEFQGVHIHHKLYDAQSQSKDYIPSQGLTLSHQTAKLNIPMILLHGFGASVFSWNRVMKPLAEITASKALAFDRPAFGLTSRVNILRHSSPGTDDRKPLNPYTMAFAVLATLYFIDFLAAEKAILVGHSAGALVAINSYFEAPERVAALILVAPAILAPGGVHKVVEGNRPERTDQIERGRPKSDNLLKSFLKLVEIISKFTQYIAGAVMQIAKGMADMLNSLYKKALSAILRSALAVMLVRMIIDKFGIAAVKTAWYDSKQVTDHILQGYTKPLRAKGWDRALVEFTAAMLFDNKSPTKIALRERLHEISCPVLIVTGDSDRLVPSWNAERLSRAIPGCCFEVIKNCGHLPHEEKAEEFVSVVDKFLKTAFASSEDQSLPAIT
ncbi:hypothetical protein SLE2022_065150 [Rubroshorea leprosula]